jgi:UDP-2-acetamido-2-deoxy-ribo-hexuluronate aminotransferase
MGFVNLKAEYKKHKKEFDKAIQNVLDHAIFIEGPEVKELEKQLAAYVGVKHCITVANGTDALLISLNVKDVSFGDEVITTPFTWISTSEVISLLGANPVFVDIDPRTFNLDPKKIEKAITNKTKAIIPVSLFGQMANFDEINAIAKKYNLFVIEDAAQSFGSTRRGNKSCSMTTLATTSFYPAKPLGCYGDGGAIFTNDDFLNEKIRMIKNHGCEKRDFHYYVGMNSRLDTIQAAILLVKFKYFENELEIRRKIANHYNEQLINLVEIPFVDTLNTHTYAEYTIKSENREKICSDLKKKNILHSIYYPKCLFQQPVYKSLKYNPEDFPEALKIVNEVVSLPIHSYLTQDEQNSIINAVKESVLQEILI